MGRQDFGWDHGVPMSNDKTKSKCNYCGRVLSGGGVSRLKQHLAGGCPNVSKCDKCPMEVRTFMSAALKDSKNKPLDRRRAEIEFRETLAGPINVDDDIDDDNDPAYRETLRRSRDEARQREDVEYFERTRPDFGPCTREIGSGSGSSSTAKGGGGSASGRGIGSFFRSKSTRPSIPIDPFAHRGQDTTQPTIPQTINKKGIRSRLHKFIAKFVHYGGLPPHAVANNPYYQTMIDEAGRCGPNVKAPTAYELMNPLLDDKDDELSECLTLLEKKWPQYGVTIMCDGWTGPTRMSLINFMACCDSQTIFLKSVDASAKIKDHMYLYDLMKEVVDFVGKENVVQIVTDNGSAFVKAGKLLMNTPGYNLFWTPCACHCIDLILKDIGKRPSIVSVMNSARTITNYIYNHSFVLAMMREKCDGDIVRPGLTRFASNYVALQSLLDKKDNLRAMFCSAEWVDYPHRREAQKIEDVVGSPSFWAKVKEVADSLAPIVRVLRLVDGDKKSTMGYLHRAFDLMKDKLRADVRSHDWIIKIIDRRWTDQLAHPLHKAAFYLNPQYQYSLNLGFRDDLLQGMQEVVAVLLPNTEEQALVLSESDVNTVTFADESGNLIYSGSDDSFCKVWDRRCLDARGEAAGILEGHIEGITFIDSRGDGRYFISNGKDQTTKLWDIRRMSAKANCPSQRIFDWDYRCLPYPPEAKGLKHPCDQSVATFRGHSVLCTLIRCYFSPAYSTGQRYIYTGSNDKCVYIYDVVTGAQVAKLAYHGSTVRDCSWHPYYPTLVSSSWDCMVVRWEFPGNDADPVLIKRKNQRRAGREIR